MLAVQPRVIDAVWTAVAGLLPPPPADTHPLGCHRPRIAERTCFEGILWRLVTGCSWRVAAAIVGSSATTLRRRRDEWIAAGVFDALCAEAIAGYDRIVGLDLSEVSVDGSQHKAPFGGQGTGRNPTDRGKQGWKWSLASDRNGIPIGWAIDAANRHDLILFEPTLAAVEDRGVLAEIDTLHLDRGYDTTTVRDACARNRITDTVIAPRRRPGQPQPPGPAPLRLGMRWTVERANSWLSNYGQLRRNTDRRTVHRHAQIALAVALILTIKLIKWADRWSSAHKRKPTATRPATDHTTESASPSIL